MSGQRGEDLPVAQCRARRAQADQGSPDWHVTTYIRTMDLPSSGFYPVTIHTTIHTKFPRIIAYPPTISRYYLLLTLYIRISLSETIACPVSASAPGQTIIMEERARIPPGLPRDRPVTSYWQDPPDEIADCRTTPELPPTADVIVVGAGVSGASISYNLLSSNPNLNVVLLEARQAASGASGRNGRSAAGKQAMLFVHGLLFPLASLFDSASSVYNSP